MMKVPTVLRTRIDNLIDQEKEHSEYFIQSFGKNSPFH